MPVLSVKMQSTTPNYYNIELFSTPQQLFVISSINFLSAVRKTPENVFIPSMKITNEIGIIKVINIKFVKKFNKPQINFLVL